MSDEVRETKRGLLDTNILIHWDRLDQRQLPLETAISAVTLAELVAGVHAATDLNERAGRLDIVQRAEHGFDPIPFDARAARNYGRIAAAVRAAGRSPLSRVADQLIAATAAANDLPLYTTNPRDYVGFDGIVAVVAVDRP